MGLGVGMACGLRLYPKPQHQHGTKALRDVLACRVALLRHVSGCLSRVGACGSFNLWFGGGLGHMDMCMYSTLRREGGTDSWAVFEIFGVAGRSRPCLVSI